MMHLSESPEINDEESKLRECIAHTLGEDIIAIHSTTEGEVNRVYKVDLQGRSVIVKIFSRPNHPEVGKDAWVNGLLQANQIHHAGLLHYSRDNQFFAYGFAISEYIEGIHADRLIKNAGTPDQQLSAYASFMENQGGLLRKVHNIRLSSYGYNRQIDLMDFILEVVHKNSQKPFVVQHGLKESFGKSLVVLEETFSKYANRISPVLIHGDCTARNTIISPTRGNVLIDWDNCGGDIWIKDLAQLVFWLEQKKIPREGIDQLKNAFWAGYGAPEDFSLDEVDEIVHALLLRRAIALLQYYFEAKKDMVKFQSVRQHLSNLLG